MMRCPPSAKSRFGKFEDGSWFVVPSMSPQKLTFSHLEQAGNVNYESVPGACAPPPLSIGGRDAHVRVWDGASEEEGQKVGGTGWSADIERRASVGILLQVQPVVRSLCTGCGRVRCTSK